MQRHRVDSQRERRILIALVVSKEFLFQAQGVLDFDAIDSELFRLVGKWCIKYFTQYGKAPGAHIEDMFHKWSDGNENTSLVESVKDFLESLGTEYEQAPEMNVPYMLDQLREFLAGRKIVRLKEAIDYAIIQGNIDEVEEMLVSYRKVEMGIGTGFNPIRDRTAMKSAFASPARSLITFEDDAGKFFNAAFTRDALVGIQAPEKCGKTWFCVEFAVRALRQRRKVALFEVGDLSQSQLVKRFAARWAQRPIWRSQCGAIPVPVSIEFDEASDSGYKIQTKTVTVRKPLNAHFAKEGMNRFRRACGMSPKSTYFRASVHPSGTLTVQGLSNILDQWELDHNFTPDIIVIDYADILAPSDTKMQARDQVNDIWKSLRRLSQERHALVIAPTQANAASYNQDGEQRLQTMKNFSEDKRKLAHCSGMLALNQSWEEKEMGGMRLNWIVLRESQYSSSKPLYIGTCFALGKAICCASFKE